MNAVKTLGIGICAAAIVGSAVKMILPQGSVSKTVKIVIAAFFICTFAASFAGSKNWFESIDITTQADEENFSYYSSLLNEQKLSAAGQGVEEQITSFLTDIGVSGEKVEVIMDIDESDSIFIKQVNVLLPPDCKLSADTVRGKILEQLGIDAAVEVENG